MPDEKILARKVDELTGEVAALRAELDEQLAGRALDRSRSGDTIQRWRARAVAAEAEVERTRPVVDAALAWEIDGSEAPRLADAVDAYRATSEQETTDA